MREKRGFHFDGADTVSGNFDDLVGAASEPNVAIIVGVCRISAGFFPETKFRAEQFKRTKSRSSVTAVTAPVLKTS
jgi:hypothetical protein